MKKGIILLACFLPLFLEAHPGHGTFSGSSFLHYLIEPVHLLSLVLVALALIVSFMPVKRKFLQKS